MDREDQFNQTVTAEDSSSVTVFVCTACGFSEIPDQLSDGQKLHNSLKSLTSNLTQINISPVDCLAVCERSVTVAFTAPGKWTYVIGDVDPENDETDIISVAKAVLQSSHGVPAMNERPPFFRKGVISRIPPPE